MGVTSLAIHCLRVVREPDDTPRPRSAEGAAIRETTRPGTRRVIPSPCRILVAGVAVPAWVNVFVV